MTILCTIDLETREVSLPAGQVIASYDHNVDVIRFQVETIPGFSLDTSSIKIAAQGPNKARHDYAVDPSTVQIEEETGYITFDWSIPAGVTEMPIGTFKYGDKGQLIFAVCAEIIDGSTVSKAWHSDDGIITVVAHLEPESGGGEDPSEEATNAQKIGQLQTDVAVINTQVGALANGSPTPVATIAEMTDESAVYLYTGSETGYTAGNWYFWNGSAWTSGGTYGGAVTSTTFDKHGVPADDFAVGQALAGKADSADVTALDGMVSDLKSDLDDIDELFDRPDDVFTGLLSGGITSTSTIYSKELTDEIAVDSGKRITYQINSTGTSDSTKITNIKLTVFRYNANHESVGVNNYTDSHTVTVPSDTAYIKLGISATTNGAAIGESVYCDITVFYADESRDTYLGDNVKVKSANIVGLTEINLVESGNIKTGIWEHLIWSSANGFVAEPESVQQHTVMKLPGEVLGGQYYTLAWGNEVRARIYVFEFSDSTYSKAAFIKAENWLPYNASTHEYAYKQQIHLDANTKYIAIMVYLSAGADSWEDLKLSNVYIEHGMDATGFVSSKVIETDRIPGTEIFDQLSSGDIVDGVPLPPEYYNEQGYLFNKCERINAVLSDIAVYGDAFIFATDQHWYLNAKQSPKLIRYIARHCHIPRLISGGDTDNGGSEELCKLYRYAFSGNIHHVVGNHDLMTSQNKQSNGAILYYMMDVMNDNQIGNNYGHYYYVDCHQQKIRYIVLSAFKGGGDRGNAQYDYSAEQLQWFATDALDAPDGYGIIIFTHFLMNASIPTAATPFINAIDLYSGNGKIIAVIQGHTHYDGLFSTATGVPVITVTCDKNSPWIDSGVDREPWLSSDRETGTIREQAFDVIGVNIDDSIVHAVRIGGLAMDNYANSNDSNFSPNGVAEERIVHCEPTDISNGATLTPTITGTITWESSNNNVATVANGTVVKVSAGKAFISASNSDGIYEYWSVVAD